MKKVILGLLVFGFTTQFMFSQEIELSEVYLDVNYKYLEAIESEDVAETVKMLEKEVAFYDLKNTKLYDDNYEAYRVSFIIPEGKISATYNHEGKILRTVERFKNVKIPESVRNSLINRFPGWSIIEDLYKVDYYDKSRIVRKLYKVKLQNGEKRMYVKLDNDGDYL